MDLRLLRHAIALADHGSFSRAAEHVHLTQPALSRSIQALEASVGATLFERRRGAIEPTEIGRLLLQHARTLDAGARELERDIRLAKGLELGDLRIVAGPWGGSALVGPAIGRLNARHPLLQVRLLVAPWGELASRAREQEVDLVVGELRDIEKLEDFEIAPLSSHDTVVVARSDHPLVRSGAESLQAMFAYPIAGPRLPADVEQALLARAGQSPTGRAGRRPVLTIECDSSNVLMDVLEQSDALSFMTRFIIREALRAGRLAEVPGLHLGMPVRFGVAWLRGRRLSGAAERFIECLRETDAALGEP